MQQSSSKQLMQGKWFFAYSVSDVVFSVNTEEVRRLGAEARLYVH